MSKGKLDWAAIRQQLNQQGGGKAFWRSLEELAQDEAFFQLLQPEFPRQMMTGTFSTNRRMFLKLMGASLVMAGLTGCNFDKPDEPIVPYVNSRRILFRVSRSFLPRRCPFKAMGWARWWKIIWDAPPK